MYLLLLKLDLSDFVSIFLSRVRFRHSGNNGNWIFMWCCVPFVGENEMEIIICHKVYLFHLNPWSRSGREEVACASEAGVRSASDFEWGDKGPRLRHQHTQANHTKTQWDKGSGHSITLQIQLTLSLTRHKQPKVGVFNRFPLLTAETDGVDWRWKVVSS